MKQSMLKTLMAVAVFTGVMSSASAQEVVTEKILDNKKWSANKVTGHSAWGTEACTALTLSGAAALEVYAEKTDAGYTEPTVHALFEEPAQVYSAELSVPGVAGAKWSLQLATEPLDANMQAVMVRMKDRAAIIEAIKKQNSMNLRLNDYKNKKIKDIPFSLSGSSKTVDEQFKKCELKFEALP